MANLDFVLTDDLLDELTKRFRAFAFAGLEEDSPDNEDIGEDIVHYRYHGGSITAMGLATYLTRFLSEERTLIDED